jgi:DNA-binding MarR family transcriptional regulator
VWRRYAGEIANRANGFPGPDATRPAAAVLGASVLAKRYLRQRRRREERFPPGLFADPAWDILLDLYVCEAEACKVSVSDACRASAVPESTALRCIRSLIAHGLIERESSTSDRRVKYLALADGARDLMAYWIEETFS